MCDSVILKPSLHEIRSSRLFIYIVIDLAVFTDAYLYGLIIPILPFALIERVNLREDEVQKWIGILVAAYGAGLIIGSRESLLYHPLSCWDSGFPAFIANITVKRSRAGSQIVPPHAAGHIYLVW